VSWPSTLFWPFPDLPLAAQANFRRIGAAFALPKLAEVRRQGGFDGSKIWRESVRQHPMSSRPDQLAYEPRLSTPASDGHYAKNERDLLIVIG
jgi:hypothetical protein